MVIDKTLLVFQWVCGLTVSLGFGHLAAQKFRDWRIDHIRGLEKTMKGLETTVEDIQKKNLDSDLIPVTTGLLERLFFTILIGAGLPDAGVAMIAWLAAKMGLNWGKYGYNSRVGKAIAMTALESGVVSLLFAMIGGLICRGWFS